MRKFFKYGLFIGAVSALLGTGDVMAASKVSKTVKKQAAIQFGTKVRGKTEAKGLYNQECYDKYYGCMDQFCIVDNEFGGSCNCSNDITKFQEALDDIKKMLADAERINTEEVEKVKAGANADIIFKGTREYDEKGNIVQTVATKDKEQIGSTMWSSFYEDDDAEYDEDEEIDLTGKTGDELYNAAHQLCEREMGEDCSNDMSLLKQMYSRQIISDCKGLANSIEQKKQEASTTLKEANANVRAALKESLEESNKYDRGTCMVEYKKCMQTEDACGSDWGICVSISTDAAMQQAVGTSSVSASAEKYKIKASTLEALESKKFICERVLNSCVAVRDFVWDDFIRDVAPTIRLAELNVESNKRQSCLMDISNCIQKACKDDIVGKGEATMDACLARPDMARSFCKVQIDPCERMEPQIFDYVKSKLAAMRVDACTQEVKDCLTAEDRCGPDYSNCIGMDFEYIHDICPIDKLVVCKQANPNFKMSDLDSMLMGLFLNVDNKALENCQNIVDEKMTELCGSTTDCNSFAADEYLGTSSVKSQKDGSIYRVTGMISFGSIKMGDATGTVKDGNKVLAPGEIGVQDYIKQVKKNNPGVPNAEGIISSIEEELNNIAGTINRSISLIEADNRVQYCINGRDLSQIKGGKKGKNQTEARFPNLLNQYRVMIAMAALRKAQDNYNKKVSTAIEEAAKDSSLDMAQYLCQKIADMGKNSSTDDGLFKEQAPLTSPFAISYDVGAGMDTKTLAEGGSSTYTTSGMDSKNGSGIMVQKEATFNRQTRVCHVCTTKDKRDCSSSTKAFGIFGLGGAGKKSSSCKTELGEPKCEDIQM